MSRRQSFKPYRLAAGGWGSASSVREILAREGVPVSGALTLARQNKPDGFQCVSCAWAKPANPLPLEFCENGAKATAWDITVARATPKFFQEHTVSELLTWDDYHLEQAGRLTQPMRYDARTDRYVAVDWTTAYDEIAQELRALPDRKGAVFYSSGRCSNEASYAYALFARLYGNNNLPDSSNMCHETTSVALPVSIGVPVGTVTLDDFAHTDCILFWGQNVGSNSPRMLHPLQECSRRGVPIIAFNPLRERGLERFTNPQSPTEMLLGEETRISSAYHQVRTGGDLAALTGICRIVVDAADADPSVLDQAFIAEHAAGFEAFRGWLRTQDWGDLERRSGLTHQAMEATAATYIRSTAAMAIYGMGLTQHRAGVETVQMLVNLLLLRGNVGRPGTGICPVRGHSNVQGQRTVGVTEKPEMVPLDVLARQFGFSPPRDTGLNTVETCEAVLAGRVQAFFGMGGNFVRAIPERDLMEAAWRGLRLTVNVGTKLNRSHLLPGAVAYLLPPLSRIEIDRQATGPQVLTMEDSLACVHASRGVRIPASKHLRSEIRIIAEIARRTLDANPLVPWDAWADDYSLIRDQVAVTYPEIFYDYNGRMQDPGGFHRVVAARQRVWKTKNGRANFVTPKGLDEDLDMPDVGTETLRMMTLRSNDQFNTTVYGYHDRFRGIKGTRMVVLMNRDDIDRMGLKEGQEVRIAAAASDGVKREMAGFRVTPYNVPAGCCGTYYPEANALIPLWHYAEGSKVPAAKSVPVRIRA